MIMAKVHECKRKAHDLCDEAHAPTARAAIKGCPLLAARCNLLAEARSLEREASGLLLQLIAPLASRGAPNGRKILSAPASCETAPVRDLYWPPAVVRRSLVFLSGQPADEIKTFSVELPTSQAVQ